MARVRTLALSVLLLVTFSCVLQWSQVHAQYYDRNYYNPYPLYGPDLEEASNDGFVYSSSRYDWPDARDDDRLQQNEFGSSADDWPNSMEEARVEPAFVTPPTWPEARNDARAEENEVFDLTLAAVDQDDEDEDESEKKAKAKLKEKEKKEKEKKEKERKEKEKKEKEKLAKAKEKEKLAKAKEKEKLEKEKNKKKPPPKSKPPPESQPPPKSEPPPESQPPPKSKPPPESHPPPPPEDQPPPESQTPPKGPTRPGTSSGCSQTGNPVDDCWRCDPDWASNRQSLASCAVGFGRSAGGGKNGRIYVVTSDRDDNPAAPAIGTLRYGVTRTEPLWITFAYSMTIKLKYELMITSYKTIDGRGVEVRIAGGGGLKMNRVSNIIVHNIYIYDIIATGPGNIMDSENHVGKRNRCDGDAISVFGSKNVWIDHCYLSNAADGLIDLNKASTGVSITNNYFTKHDKVMLFGSSPKDEMDRDMYATVAYNKFGPGCVQRMPRVRYGYCHVVNNDYSDGWGIYAIAGSQAPTILSQGNVFNAFKCGKQVTKRIDDGGPTFGGPGNWNWKSDGDSFEAGAYFSGVDMKWSAQSNSQTESCTARPASMVKDMVRDVGPLTCRPDARCS